MDSKSQHQPPAHSMIPLPNLDSRFVTGFKRGVCVADASTWRNPFTYSYERPNTLQIDSHSGEFNIPFLPVVFSRSQLVVYANISLHAMRVFRRNQTPIGVNTSMAIVIFALDLAVDSPVSGLAVCWCIFAVADVLFPRSSSHLTSNFEPEVFRLGTVGGSGSRNHGMRDLLEEKTVFCACPALIYVWDGVPGIAIFQLRMKMVRATTNSLVGLVVVVANSRMNTFIRFRIWEWRQLGERPFLPGLHCIC